MKVLFVSSEYPPWPGGVGFYTKRMAEALVEAGREAVVVTSHGGDEVGQEEINGVHIYRMPAGIPLHHHEQTIKILLVANKHRVDFIEGADHGGAVAGLLRRSDRPPVIVKVHGSNPVRVLWESHLIHVWQRPLIRAAQLRAWRQMQAERACIEKADALTSPCVRMLEELSRQDFVLPVQRAALPNPVELKSYSAGMESAYPTLLMVGRLDIGKGIQYLPLILSKLVSKYPDLRLEIAGDDSYARGLGSLKNWLVNHLGRYARHVHFLGRLNAEQLNDAYNRAWVIIVPSRWDTFPTVVLEAMARGKPVVGSIHGGMREMLEETECNAFSPDSDAFIDEVDRLLADQSARWSAGHSMRRKAETSYAPRVVAEQYIDFIENTFGINDK